MKIVKVSFLCIALCLVTISCVKDVDFDQAEGIVLTPVIESNLLFFDEPAPSFVNENGSEVAFVKDSVVVEVFNDEFVRDNLQKAILLFEATNTINRGYEAKVDFLNEADELQYTLLFNIPTAVNNQEVLVEQEEVFEGDNLEAFKTTNKLALTLTMFPSTDGSSLDEDSLGSLRFRSKGTFFFNIDTSE